MSRLLIQLFCLFSLLLSSHALPLVVRQDAAIEPTTVTTTNTQNTAVGQMVTTCEITLTPIKDANGNDAVEQVTKCKVAMNGANNGSSPPASQEGEDTTIADSGTTSTESATTTAETTVETTSETQSATETATETSTTEAPSSEGQLDGGESTIAEGETTTDTATAEQPTDSAVRDNGASSVAVSDLSSLFDSATASPDTTATATQEGAEATAAPSAEGAASTGESEGEQSADGQADAQEGASPTAEQQNEASASAAGSFELPGKKLSVLPIGLGVFAGISVIALIVVGLVTYERTKYRKAFRQRKLAEQGASMGYGGNMTERT